MSILSIYRAIMTSHMNTDSAVSYDKLTHDQWNRLEHRFNGKEKIVVDMLLDLGVNKNSVLEHNLIICGDIYDEVIRPELSKIGLLDNMSVVKKSQKKKKKINKKEQIIEENKKNMLSQALVDVISTFSSGKMNYELGFRSKYAELRLATLIYCANFICGNNKKMKVSSKSKGYELIVGIKKALTIATQIGVSKASINDIEELLVRLMKEFEYNYRELLEKYPMYVISTKYDDVFPTLSVRPYGSQIELMSKIRDNRNGLFLYNAMIGSGKTSFSIALASYVRTIRTMYKSKIQLIFCCSVEPVRYQVGQYAYNANIPFGVASIVKGNLRVINHFSCKKDNERVLIISDLSSTIALLQRSKDYMLFVDEPTVGADQKNSPITKSLLHIMELAPSSIILSSATLPKENEIEPIIASYKEKYVDTHIESIYSKEAIIGCHVKSYNGDTICPHSWCKTKDELKNVIKHIDTNPFLGRLYTAPILLNLHRKMVDEKIEGLPDIDDYFKSISNLTQYNIQKMAVQLLHILAETDVIDKVCDRIKLSIDKVEKVKNDEDMWDNEEDDNNFNPTKLGTTDAHKYMGGCLIATQDPLKYAMDNFKEIYEKSISAKNLIAKYSSLRQIYDKQIKRIDDRVKNESKKSLESQAITEPLIDYPEELRINTIKHLETYAKDKLKTIDANKIKSIYALEDISSSMNIPDWVYILLFSGVGIFCPSSPMLDEVYIDTVMGMASDGHLSYLIADDSICFGANYPINNIIIDDSIVDNHSIKTIFQLMGRAGRVGQSWTAYAHIGVKCEKMLREYTMTIDIDLISDEAINMNNMLEIVKKEKEMYPKIVRLDEIV